MKNLKFLSMMLMLMVGLVSFSACSDDDNDNNGAGFDKDGNPSIVGKWTFDSDKSDQWNSKEASYKETLTFNNNGTGTVTGTMIDKGTPAPLNANFDYVLSWKDGVGTLKIVNMRGTWGLTGEGTYRLNASTYDRLSSTLLILDGIAYKR